MRPSQHMSNGLTQTPTAQQLALRKAANASFFVYAQLFRLSDEILGFPERWRPNSLAKALRAEFSKKFLPWAQRVVREGRDPRYLQVEKACKEWAQNKYGQSRRATRFAGRLEALAFDALTFSEALAHTDVVRAASEILTERKRTLPSPTKISRLRSLLQELGFSREKGKAIVKEARDATMRCLITEDRLFKVGP